MKGSWMIASVKGIQIFIHWTFFILLGWVALSEINGDGSVSSVLYEVGFMLSIFLCVLLHELGHALTAARYHIKTKDITLLPIGGVARLEKMPEKPKQELMVAIAGPLVNVWIVAVLGVIIYFGKGFPLAVDFVDIESNGFLVNITLVNISLVVFNMIPAFPMDGGRVLRALLSMKWPREQATRMAASLGQVIAALFVIGGLFFNPMLIIIGVFVFLGAQGEYKMTVQQSAFRNVLVKELMIADYISLKPESTFQEGVNALLSGYVTDFLVLSEGRVLGFITRDDLLKGYAVHGRDASITVAVHPADFSAKESDSLDKAWRIMMEQDLPLLPVYRDAELKGILSKENVTEFLALHLLHARS